MGEHKRGPIESAFLFVGPIGTVVMLIGIIDLHSTNDALRDRAMVDGTTIVTLREMQQHADRLADAYRRELLRQGLTEDDLRALLASDGPMRTPEGRR